MKRVRTSLLLLLVVALGCSRHDAAPPAPSEASTATAPPAAAPAVSSASHPGPGLPTPDDSADDDAARHITEQNLESELDRLEREIQAE